MEKWKLIPEYPNYAVSNRGRVASNLSGSWKIRRLKLIQKGKGKLPKYYGINVKVDGVLPSGKHRTKTLKVHQLVASLFIGPQPEGMLVLHKDDNRNNNSVDNLVYGTQSDNVKMWVKNRDVKYIKNPDGKFAGCKISGT